MPYSITTKDGITINGIPDDVDPNSDELKKRVAVEREKAPAGEGPVAPKLKREPPPILGSDNKPIDLDPTADMGHAEKFITGIGGGLTDKWLGAKQLAASVGMGDKEALAKEAADKEQIDKPLDTGWGAAGKFTGQMAPDLLLGGGLGAGAAKMLPQTAKLARALTNAGVQGAEAGLLTPGEDYDPVKGGLLGAGLGVGGDVAGRGLGRALRPMQAALPERVKEQVAQLAGMPGMIAENLTDNKLVRSLTNALAQLGPAGGGVNEARLAKLAQHTVERTGEAGAPTKAITEGRKEAMIARLRKQAEDFRAGPDVPLGDISENLRPTLAEVQKIAELSGTSVPGQIGRAIEATTPTYRQTAGGRPSIIGTVGKALSEQPNPNIMRTIQQAVAETPGSVRTKLPNDQLVDLLSEYGPAKGVARPGQFTWTGAGAPVGPQIPTGTAEQVFRARSIASDLAHKADISGDSVKAAGARKLRDELEAALVKTQPGAGTAEEGAAFRKWKKEYGAKQDIIETMKEKGLTPEGHILPEKYLNRIDIGKENLSNVDKRTIALAERAASPTLAENRSFNVRLLMGGIPAVGGALGLGAGAGLGEGDNKTLGTGAGIGASLALAHLLLGTKGGGRYLTGQTESSLAKALQSEDLKKLLQMLAISKGGEYGGSLGNK